MFTLMHQCHFQSELSTLERWEHPNIELEVEVEVEAASVQSE